MSDTEQSVIMYDGVCGLCERTVHFIARRDTAERFVFTTQQSETGKRLLAQFHIPTTLSSIVLIRRGQAYQGSDAVLHIGRELPGFALIASTALLIPRPLREPLYWIIARLRYRIFGRTTGCPIPSPQFRKRCLDAKAISPDERP